jgi:hypothetical protein
MSELVLTGLDAKNPLGFMAALGALNALADRRGPDAPEPKLGFRTGGSYVPAIFNGPDREGLVDVLLDDLRSFRAEPAIEKMRYRKESGKGAEAHDLKPPKGLYGRYLKELVETGSARSLAYAAAFATDVALDNNGNTKPTALHFTAGQQEFLAMITDLIAGVGEDDLIEALFGPWTYTRPLPVLQWDNASARDYALRASDPSKDKKLGVPGADWLAFRGLPFFPVVPDESKTRIATTGCYGGWKTGGFRWPVWRAPLTRPVIRALLSSEAIFEADPASLRARGVEVVFEVGIRRSDQGGYGSFTPARVAEPQKKTKGARR